MIEYVTVRDASRAQIGIIDLYGSLLWIRDYRGTGEFELYAQATQENAQLLQIGNYITRDGDDEVGIIERIEKVYSAQDGTMITAGGRFAKSLLDRRVIYKLSGTSNAPAVLRGNVEAAARRLVTENIVSSTVSARNISFIQIGASAGTTQVIVDDSGNAADKQTTAGNLLEFTDTLLSEYDLGAHMTLDAQKKLNYSVFEGDDRSASNEAGNNPVIFSQQFDNLLESAYFKDITELKTTALVGGEGEGIERFYAVYGNSASGTNRRERFINASSVNKKYKDENDVEQTYTDAEYRSLLLTHARQDLAEHVLTESFSGSVDVTSSQYAYKTDYNLGDIVTLRDELIGLEIAARIERITESQDDNGYAIDIEFKS